MFHFALQNIFFGFYRFSLPFSPQLYLASDLQSFQKVGLVLILIIYWTQSKKIHYTKHPQTVKRCVTNYKCGTLICILTLNTQCNNLMFVLFTRSSSILSLLIFWLYLQCAKKSRLQEVNLVDSGSFLSWWKVVHFDPQERLENEGLPVPVSL